MQYYRDGFYLGDPRVSPTAPTGAPSASGDDSDVDVLVVGTGPAGLVLAAQLARFHMLRTRIVERREGPLQLGQADGVACRSVEMFQAFGLAGRMLEEAYWVNETRFWRPDPTAPESIVRTARVQDVEDGLSEMPHLIMNQARIHDYLLTAMRSSPTRLEPDYGKEVVDLERLADDGPVVVTLRDVATGATTTCRARYVAGCDGARSQVRDLIGRRLHGDRAGHAWGVVDLLGVSDFPDIRFKAAIQSAEHGSILLIPREGGHLVRLYVDLGAVTEENRAAVRTKNVEEVLDAARAVLSPYRLDVREVVWFSVYEVAQRIADGFDDAGGTDRPPRVFIVGDACHTHSAKAGQGMNVSMQDAFNLGWKLGAVVEGRADPSMLRTYDEERRPVAQKLLDFDREWSTMLASPEAVAEYFVRQGRYTAGVATHYPASSLVGSDTHQGCASGFILGTRFHSAPVTRIPDGRRVQLGHAATADGRWRLYAFADAHETAWRAALDWWATDPASPALRHARPGDDLDAVVDVRGIVQQPAHDAEDRPLPEALRPVTGRLRLVDHEKSYAATTAAHRARLEEDIFEIRGIDRATGALVLVRPDQYVAQVLPLSAVATLGDFFDALLVGSAAAGAADPTVRA